MGPLTLTVSGAAAHLTTDDTDCSDTDKLV